MRKRSGISDLPVEWSPHDPTYTVRMGANTCSSIPTNRVSLFYPVSVLVRFYDLNLQVADQTVVLD
jgi:hypothetical protein